MFPLIRHTFPDTHKLMQDNDPIHTSQAVKAFFEMEYINWWKPPPESPDMNPSEILWHDFIRCQVTPTTKAELILGIKQFWDTVDVTKHLRKVVPKMISLEGAA